MLKFVSLEAPQAKKSLFEGFNPQEQTWIVSDLRTKFEIQRKILAHTEYFEDLSVYRASELWRFILKKARPEMTLVSQDFVKTFLKEELRKEPLDLSQNADQVVLQFMDLLISVHSHPEGGESIRDWFSNNPEAKSRWFHWFELSEKYVHMLLNKNLLTAKWVTGFLQNEQDLSVFWDRELIVDLGCELSRTEAELLKTISRATDVTILSPDPTWRENFSYLLQPYEDLKNISLGSDRLTVEPTSHSRDQVLRFSGVLSEAKYAVSQVRAFLELGVLEKQIAVVAPDIEAYWPILAPLFAQEGIPVAKDQNARMQTFPMISAWIAQLRMAIKTVSFADLEAAVFKSETKIRYEDFFALFSEMLSAEDLARSEVIEKAFQGNIDLEAPLSREEFVGFCLRFWNESAELYLLENILREIFASSNQDLKMRAASWVYFVEQIVSRKEIRTSSGSLDGVQLTNLSSADSLSLTHRIFLGLSENQIKDANKSLVSPSDVGSISALYGFFLAHPEISAKEFDLRWQAENTSIHNIYCFPQTSFSGSAEAPTSFWLERAKIIEENLGKEISLTAPEINVWDSLQKSDVSQVLHQQREWSQNRVHAALQRIQEDLGTAEIANFGERSEIKLSASSLERYRECPFIFASEKVFNLMDLPVVDLDLDRRNRGELAHALFEKLTNEPRRFDYTVADLRQIIDQVRIDIDLKISDEFIWQGLKERHVGLAQRFLAFEKEWKAHFPETKVAAAEKSFQFYYNPETKTLSNETSPILFRGKIDRIDKDSMNRWVVLDYKSGAGDLKNSDKWMSENQLQLALYALALDSKLVEDFAVGEVIGAFYYVFRNFNRNRGFKVAELAGTLFDLDAKKNRITAEGKEKLYEALLKVLEETLPLILRGQFAPKPLDLKTCDTCNWNKLCRAPHLN